MVIRTTLALLPILLTACIEGPPSQPGTAVDDVLSLAPNTAIAAGCSADAVTLTWTVEAHPRVERYDAVVTADSTEVERLSLGSEGSGVSTLAPTSAQACVNGCTVSLVAVTPADLALLSVDLLTDADEDGYAAGECGGEDCDDSDSTIRPGATETCDGVDNDCDGQTDNLPDAPLADLQDGVCSGAQKVCDGTGGFVEPDYTTLTDYQAVETECDGLDNDCDGQADNLPDAPLADLQDGVCAGAKKTCDGEGGFVEPDYAAYNAAYADLDNCDGLDNDCDGDADDEGTAPAADLQQGVCAGSLRVCGGTSGWVEPDYTTIADYETVESRCDALDNDCNGQADDLSDAPLADLQDGVCAGAKKTCDGAGGFVEPDYTAYNAAYADLDDCDGLDNDCDGDADDEGTAPDADLQDGVCAGSLRICGGTSGWVEPNYTAITDYETVESLCDSIDNDCDGAVDVFSAPELANKQLGVCAGAVKTCNGTEWVEPDYAVYSADYESLETVCDELDNDCDGVVDTVTDVLPDETEFVCWGNGLVHQPRLVDEGSWADVALNVNGSLGCGLDTEGRLLCWGKGQWYDDSAGFVPGTLAPRELIAGSRWRDIMLTEGPDGDTVLGILEDGTLAVVQDGVVATPLDSGPWASITGTSTYGCMVSEAGDLACWRGNGNYTQPTTELAAQTIVEASITNNHACALTDAGTIFCWGSNSDGQLGPDNLGQTGLPPVEIPHPTGGTWLQIATPTLSSCALDDSGIAWCWGDNGRGALGNNDLGVDSADPVQVLGGPWDSLTPVFDDAACATSGTEFWCWGEDTDSLGFGGGLNRPSPERVSAEFGGGPAHLAPFNSCLVHGTTQDLWCWGFVDRYAIMVNQHQPRVLQTANIVAFDADLYNTCLVHADGTVYCGGLNYEASPMLGDPTLLPSGPELVQVPIGASITSVVIGDDHVCGLDTGGARWCWGRNWSAQLGTGDTITPTAPVSPDDGGLTWSSLAAGTDLTMGIDSNGVLYRWGDGCLACGLERLQDSDETWRQVVTDNNSTCAIDTAGDLACWGTSGFRGTNGDGGVQGSRTYSERFVHPGPWRTVDIKYARVCGVRESGELFCWGRDFDSTPVQFDGSYDDVSVGEQGVCARLENSAEQVCMGARYDAMQGYADLIIDRFSYTVEDWSQFLPAGFGTMSELEVDYLSCGLRQSVQTFECPATP